MAGLELHEAASTGDTDTLEELLRSGKLDVNLKDEEWLKQTPLHWACTKGFAEVIRLLLDHGARGSPRMAGGWTPAHCAAETGKMTALRALVNANVPVDKPDKYGVTPRRLAQIYGHTECVRFLVQAEVEQAEKRRNNQLVWDEDEEMSDLEP